MDKNIKQLIELIKKSNDTVFFGGAGVSTASGIPDFRGENGIYKTELSAEVILTTRYMLKDPRAYYHFYRKYFMPKDILPNDCHRVLARLEERGYIKTIITQNVDGLHQDAGSVNVLELHGSGKSFHCHECGKNYTFEEVDYMPTVPYCECGGIIRGDIVLYEEGLDSDIIRKSCEAIAESDLLIIGGTSLTVYPAAGLINYQRGGAKVLINKEITSRDSAADYVIREPIELVFKKIEELW